MASLREKLRGILGKSTFPRFYSAGSAESLEQLRTILGQRNLCWQATVSRRSGLERTDKDCRIDPCFIQADIPVKVRSCRSPCRTDQTDHRAPCQGLTRFDINPGKVAEHT